MPMIPYFDSKMLPLNSYLREDKLDLFARLVPKGFCGTKDFVPVTHHENMSV